MAIYGVMQMVQAKVEIACLKVYLVSYDSYLEVLLQRGRLRVTRLIHNVLSTAAQDGTQLSYFLFVKMMQM
jgi:hypothetical protein